MKKRIKFIFYGKVQNIAFRHFTKILADQEQIKGFVKNNTDGSVTAIAEGDQNSIDQWLTRVKSQHLEAVIDKIITKEIPIDFEYLDYLIIE